MRSRCTTTPSRWCGSSARSPGTPTTWRLRWSARSARSSAGRAEPMPAQGTRPPRGKAVPEPTPDTQPYWDGAAAGELRIQRCLDCRVPYFYPRPICPSCGSDQVEWFTASGDATLDSYVIYHRSAPVFEEEGPYAIAVVQRAEGPRMMSSRRGVPATP